MVNGRDIILHTSVEFQYTIIQQGKKLIKDFLLPSLKLRKSYVFKIDKIRILLL